MHQIIFLWPNFPYGIIADITVTSKSYHVSRLRHISLALNKYTIAVLFMIDFLRQYSDSLDELDRFL